MVTFPNARVKINQTFGRCAKLFSGSACSVVMLLSIFTVSCSSQTKSQMADQKHSSETGVPEMYSVHLSNSEYDVLVNKGTDRPGDGGYTNLFDRGVYHCRACGTALYKSETKFHSGCGWPSFETEIPGTVKRNVDRAFGMIRTEIVCATCGGHLGHEFQGERITPANNRHCVNTSSIVFHPENTQTLYIADSMPDELQFALYDRPGVLMTRIGEIQVTDNAVGALKATEVRFDPASTSATDVLILAKSTRNNDALVGFTIGVPVAQDTKNVSSSFAAAKSFRPYGPELQHAKLRAARKQESR